MYKALITDLDGTAVPVGSDGSEIDMQTRQAVKAAIKKGYKLACATGREWELAKPVIDSLGLMSACIIEGGTRIVEVHNGKTLWEKYFAADMAKHSLSIFKQHSKTGIFMSSADDLHQSIDMVSGVSSQVRYMYLLGVTETVAIDIANTINEYPSIVAHLTPSWVEGGLYDVHVTHAEGTKEHAIKVWQTMENITQNETIGMGDSGNDIPIFQASGFKVAVANATPDLLGLADYISPAVSDHGLEYIINTYLL